MALVTKDNEDRREPTDEDLSNMDREAENHPEPEAKPVPQYESRTAPAAPAGIGGGWFHIYKSGQGYWTRMGTVAGCALLMALMGNFLYSDVLTAHDVSSKVAWIATGAFVVTAAIVLWRVLNAATVVDFFIATESEMKKVNWTSRKELFGSTKVVIFFMFLISACLFVIDIVFGYLFYFIHVLKQPPL